MYYEKYQVRQNLFRVSLATSYFKILAVYSPSQVRFREACEPFGGENAVFDLLSENFFIIGRGGLAEVAIKHDRLRKAFLVALRKILASQTGKEILPTISRKFRIKPHLSEV